MPANYNDGNPEVALESDVPEFTRAIVNRRLAAMGSSVRIGGDIELSRETLDYAAREAANDLWGIIVRALQEAHPGLTRKTDPLGQGEARGRPSPALVT